MDNKDDLNELLARASEEDNNTDNVVDDSSNVNDNNFQENIDIIKSNGNFSGYFHERDRLDHNNIVYEVNTSFMEYSMSVIKSRALPDLRDGLKPVHRRILWSMYESGYTPD